MSLSLFIYLMILKQLLNIIQVRINLTYCTVIRPVSHDCRDPDSSYSHLKAVTHLHITTTTTAFFSDNYHYKKTTAKTKPIL